MASENSDEDTLRSDSPPPTDYRVAAGSTVNFAQAQTTMTQIFSVPATIYDSGAGHVWFYSNISYCNLQVMGNDNSGANCLNYLIFP
ncbi:unnamed protein product [Cuscuta campestris]|uniref:Uncharacterized protein n=1 Tax=Cuscuta campestris TaxID=132261 RepID=A0A484L3F4_9ASTE|nr:unnamed protein product [Cuscuta campestris]